MSTRVNARLDDELSRKLERLRQKTGLTTTEIVAASIEAYYVAMTSQVDTASLFGEFVGSGDAGEDLSEQYKSALGESLARKARAR